MPTPTGKRTYLIQASIKQTNFHTKTPIQPRQPLLNLPQAFDGNNINGAGIYVQGDTADIKIYGETNGDQVYAIKQGSTTTTITTKYSLNQKTISNGSTTRVYSGVFKDRSHPAAVRNGTSSFVNGSINSLRGGKDSSTNRPAIASTTALTIAAQRNIRVTGDLKYSDRSPIRTAHR